MTPMTSIAEKTCTSEEAISAVGHIARCWGGFAIPDDEKRAFMRLFVTYPPAAVGSAIDNLVRAAGRRPSPADLGGELRRTLPAVRDTRPTDPWPEITPENVSRHIAELRDILAGRKAVPA